MSRFAGHAGSRRYAREGARKCASLHERNAAKQTLSTVRKRSVLRPGRAKLCAAWHAPGSARAGWIRGDEGATFAAVGFPGCARSFTSTWMRSTRLWNSVTILHCAAGRWWWRGRARVQWFAPLRTKRAKFGVRSAMPALRAERPCPDAVFVPPDFTRYKAVLAAGARNLPAPDRPGRAAVAGRGLSGCHRIQDRPGPGDRDCPLVRAQIREETQLMGIGGNSAEQVPGQDRLGLAQAGRPVRGAAFAGRGFPPRRCRSTRFPGWARSCGGAPGSASGHHYRRRVAHAPAAGVAGAFRQLRPGPVQPRARYR